VTDIVLRRRSREGTSNLKSLSEILKLPVAVIHSVFAGLRQQQLSELKAMAGNDYRICLSEGVGAPWLPGAFRSAGIRVLPWSRRTRTP
jgi:hypothetical protein